MNLLDIYNSYKKRALSMDNKEFNKCFDLIEQGNRRKIILSPRGYGKTSFLVKKAIKAFYEKKQKTLIVGANYKQATIIKYMLDKVLKKLKIEIDENNIKIISGKLKNIRGIDLKKYDYIFADDSEFADNNVLQYISVNADQNTVIVFTASKKISSESSEMSEKLIKNFSQNELITINDEEYERRLRSEYDRIAFM